MKKGIIVLAVAAVAAVVWYYATQVAPTDPASDPNAAAPAPPAAAAREPVLESAAPAAESPEDLSATQSVIRTTRPDPQAPCDEIEVDGERVCWDQVGYSPYLTYTLDELRAMAVNDAAAADALVLRLPTYSDERMAYALHAAQLSGRPGSLYRYVLMTPIAMSDYQRQIEMYALLVYADTLGTQSPQAAWLEAPLRADLGLSREELLARAEEALERLMERAASAREAS